MQVVFGGDEMTAKGLFRILAAVAALVLAVGCSTPNISSSIAPAPPSSATTETAAPETVQQLRVPRFTNDSLNPYTCQTLQNYYLAGLLCDPLVALDSNNQPDKRLALEVSTSDNLRFVVTLRDDAYFSDGSLLGASDVIYSLELARQNDRFAAGLAGVIQAQKLGESSVSITLAQPNIYFVRSLCFPVVKSGTGSMDIPVGVGRFTYSEDGELLRNSRHYRPVRNVSRVITVAAESLEEQSYLLLESEVNLIYSALQSGLNLGLGIGYHQIPLSNLVFLGVNHNRAWATTTMRQVVSGLVRREELVRRAYTGFASVASIPISPVASVTALEAADLEMSPERQKTALESEGWLLQPDGTRRRNGVTLSLELLCNSESSERHSAAELAAEMLRAAGIQTTVIALPHQQYLERIETGSYDLYIAETRLPYNMEFSRLIPSGLFPELEKIYRSTLAGETAQEELETALRNELPVIPLLFRRGVLSFSRDFSANMVATEQDIFYNVEEW